MKQDFPEVNGKIIESITLSVGPDYSGICIRFQDKTGLAISIKSCVIASPVYADWTGGEEKMLKEYKPIRSDVSLETEDGTEARLKES
jgi:hypothetical protein